MDSEKSEKKQPQQPQQPPPVEEPTQDTAQEAAASPTVDFTKDPEIAAYIDLRVQEGIQKALQGKPPKVSTVDSTEQERKNFDKMTYKERLTLFNSNPQAYNKLSKGSM